MVFHSKGRNYSLSVYLGTLPELKMLPSDGDDGQPNLANPADRWLWQQIIAAAPVVWANPDTTYAKGKPTLLKIPDSCDCWVDENSVVVAKESRLCQNCHCLFNGDNCPQCQQQEKERR